MKFHKFRYIVAGLALCCASIGFTSCEDYLDKSPESDLKTEDAFKNFVNFQGFVEEMYSCMPDFANGYWTNSWNWGDDEVIYVGCDYHMTYKVDQGDFWGWQSDYDGWQSGWMDRRDYNPSNATKPADERLKVSLWKGAWYSIRKCNVGIENFDYFTEGTQEEKDMILGQLYFFRAWYHFELMQYLGGLPYIDKVIAADEPMKWPRLSYKECADKAAADFRKAADLLPVDWDQTVRGRNTVGKNGLRVNKITALAYLGKNYLWAASPLMKNTNEKMVSNTKASTYDYDQTYAKLAADAFGELLGYVQPELNTDGKSKTKCQYELADFGSYSEIFYTQDKGGETPGLKEAILRTPTVSWNNTNWGLSKQFGGKILTGSNSFSQAAANYVNYYGMENGLPLTDAESGFDATHPWKGRDPRFYHDIVYDGVKVVKGTISPDDNRYANLYTGGSYRNDIEENRTGYMLYKFIPMDANNADDGYGWGRHLHINIPWLRLSDVYLMYAESLAALGGANQKSSTFNMTAEQAVNVIRERAGVADVNAKFTADKDKFMDEVRRERAVELAYEGHRFNDLRRWLLLDKYPYNIKTQQNFNRVSLDTKDSKNSEVSDFKEKTIVTRNFKDKHYWFPLKKKDVSIYPELFQNPGW